jgi:hypothetical protein
MTTTTTKAKIREKHNPTMAMLYRLLNDLERIMYAKKKPDYMEHFVFKALLYRMLEQVCRREAEGMEAWRDQLCDGPFNDRLFEHDWVVVEGRRTIAGLFHTRDDADRWLAGHNNMHANMQSLPALPTPEQTGEHLD